MIPTLLRLLGIAVAIALLMRWLQNRKRPDSDFHDVVKNPDLWDSFHEHFQQRDRELEQARHWSHDEIALAIEHYVFKLKHSEDDREECFQKLSQQPEKAAEQALQVLIDPDMQSRLRKEPRGEPALFRAVQVLMLAPNEHAPSQVRRLLTASDDNVRSNATQWHAQVADGTSVDNLIESLRNDESRWSVLHGLNLGKHAPGSRIAIDMFQPLATLLTEPVDACDYELTAKLLLQWDPERARMHMEEVGIFHPTHAAFDHSLRAMLTAGVWLPREQLRALWQLLEQQEDAKVAAVPVLCMLASYQEEEDLPLLHHILEQEQPTSEAAAKALLTYHGLQDWVRTATDTPRQQRSHAQQAAMAALQYTSNVSVGGHAQFFCNTSGDSWQEALLALESAGDVARLEILREAIARFPAPPASDRESRQIQIARMAQASANGFDDLDTRYDAVARPAEVTVARLVLQSPKAFRA